MLHFITLTQVLSVLTMPCISFAQITFTEQAETVGILAYNTFGGVEKSYIVEAHGSGAGFFDYDNDGDLDLYLVNGATFDTYRTKSGPGNSLYENGSDGIFRDVAKKLDVDDAGWGAGCAVGDIDNDGLRDLYVTNYRENVLYRNLGEGGFKDITNISGVAGDGFSAAAAFLDYDNDGDLDLYVTNYVQFDLANKPKTDCDYVGGIKTYCGPLGMIGDKDVFYRNDGNGKFVDVTAISGIGTSNDYFGLGIVPADYDGDGDVDLYVANDQTPNLLFRNESNGTFIDVGLISGVAYNGDGDEEAGMGVDFGDYDNDGDLDLYVTNFFRESNTLYRNEGLRRFSDYTIQADLEAVTIPWLGWGTNFADFDNDGDLDLFVANGHVFPKVDDAPTGTSYRQRNQVFRNDSGKFYDVTSDAGPGLQIKKVSRGASFGDYDNDGDMDIVIVNLNDTPTLLRNNSSDEDYWLIVRVEGTNDNRDGAGAQVRVHTGSRSQLRAIDSSGSYLSANDIRAHFGVGSSTVADSVVVTWLDGSRTLASTVPMNKILYFKQGSKPVLRELSTL